MAANGSELEVLGCGAFKPEGCKDVYFETGLYESQVMPFGLTSAPATFERLMETVLAGLQWNICLIYLDDVIVIGKNFEDMLQNLSTVFDRLLAAGLKLKTKKCQLFAKEVTYLGHVISEKRIATNGEKVKIVKQWPVPINLMELRSFLGFCGYYRTLVRRFSRIASCLHELTKTDKHFEWTEVCHVAFENLKQCLIGDPILARPDFTQPFILDTDASDKSIGAVLSQSIDGVERPVAYAGRTLTKSEKRYCVTRKELQCGFDPMWEKNKIKDKKYAQMVSRKMFVKDALKTRIKRRSCRFNRSRKRISCSKRKSPCKTKRAPMQILESGFPMEKIAIDIICELLSTKMGNRHSLVVSDYYTKWTESFAMPNMEAQTVAKVLVEEVISRFGVPYNIHSDQGSQFESSVIKEVYLLLQINKTHTTPYHPKSDGMVERFNKTLVAMLSAFVNEHQTDWDEHLLYMMMAYRSTEDETTGNSLNSMMLGRETNTPLDI
ncbi:uncharacterized protein K02A2.6-like [Mizuhopecten yessoensis]|uniref:uncharacterized protein K02A2.6-like n=1 Tax=Mizuhopecten yessoensis TaxID=6573 RepID=UPI000B457716|nr:uncharacterized protein K02A2.6-like [Mizuhopecten yessoensis]